MAPKYPQEDDSILREKPIPEIMPFLNEQYGSRIVAFALQETPDLSQIERFQHGQEIPDSVQESKMRDMVEIAEILQRKGCTCTAIQALMFGMNQSFDGEAPIIIIRQGNSADVVAAAPGFMEGYK